MSADCATIAALAESNLWKNTMIIQCKVNEYKMIGLKELVTQYYNLQNISIKELTQVIIFVLKWSM